jgi:hypothetical protein
MTDALPKTKPAAPEASDGTLLALLMVAFYVIFTLVPGSSTLIVSWPWVFLWQVGLTLPMLWQLWQLWHRPLVDEFVTRLEQAHALAPWQPYYPYQPLPGRPPINGQTCWSKPGSPNPKTSKTWPRPYPPPR